LILVPAIGILSGMGVPDVPPTLTQEQLADLQHKLSHMRHEVNNQLSLIVAALELIRFRPEMREKMLNTLGEQPPKIMAEISKFSVEFEQTFGITRDK
jgi:TolA-binding protein